MRKLYIKNLINIENNAKYVGLEGKQRFFDAESRIK
jgi:hypothetical protein